MMRQTVTYPEAAYQTVVLPETLNDGTLVYVANHPDLRGCRSQADTPEHAQENLSEVFESYARHFAAHGLDMPAPQQKLVHTVIWRSAALGGAWNTSVASPTLPLMMGISRPVPGFERALAKSEREHVA
ncbi:MAG: type II toxin-antitoxin system HicB family antitoxin [Ktedonobacterales bacterium]